MADQVRRADGRVPKGSKPDSGWRFRDFLPLCLALIIPTLLVGIVLLYPGSIGSLTQPGEWVSTNSSFVISGAGNSTLFGSTTDTTVSLALTNTGNSSVIVSVAASNGVLLKKTLSAGDQVTYNGQASSIVAESMLNSKGTFALFVLKSGSTNLLNSTLAPALIFFAFLLAIFGFLYALKYMVYDDTKDIKDQALGLPAGSIRTVIALAIVFFALFQGIFHLQIQTEIITLLASLVSFYFGAAIASEAGKPGDSSSNPTPQGTSPATPQPPTSQPVPATT